MMALWGFESLAVLWASNQSRFAFPEIRGALGIWRCGECVRGRESARTMGEEEALGARGDRPASAASLGDKKGL